MRIIALVENTTLYNLEGSIASNLETAHGLALYIETLHHKILFDVGPNNSLFNNANSLKINLTEVDTVIISHGHKDHGGALEQFMELNHHAKVYMQKRALLPHFSHRPTGVADIGLNTALQNHPQVILLEGNHKIDAELELFTVTNNKKCASSANGSLYENNLPDNFLHEQNLIIKEEKNTLSMGCGHNGVVNIMAEAENIVQLQAKDKFCKNESAAVITTCVGGFHLTNPSARRNEPKELLDQIVEHLKKYKSCTFYTCHCTGTEVYNYLKEQMGNINYLSCGMVITLDA